MIEKRGAGILMHVTSLPSAFGIGDFGPEARKFVDFLKDSLQQYWQILPITFIDKSQRYSPYSPLSSIAGNIWLISPELLYQEGLIDKKDLELAKQSSNEAVDYQKVTEGKTSLFDTAYTHFLDMDQRGFASFCRKESWWLDDFSLFMALKKNFKQMPWCQWPKEYRNRKATSLKQFISHHETEINKTKWLQFIFYTQWRNLKDYCNGLNIKIVGDLPFYISYDSVDVWSNPDLFSIDKNGRIEEMAGVPPDYFNSSGQLWGMPVYNWPAHKKEKFSWWVNRFRKNLELSDIVRIDHFRALCQYWSVPATEKNAIKGKWRTGPGAQFFEKLKVELGELAIVAEDLGDIDSQVHELRDQFNLPGMKVIQFAFGKNMSQSDHIPHNFNYNFFVYSGTHDNNTVVGWFNLELTKKIKSQIASYAGMKITRDNIHEVIIRMAYGSVCKTSIIPIQDILGLDEKARMNTPASIKGNWIWRLQAKSLNKSLTRQLASLTLQFGRN